MARFARIAQEQEAFEIVYPLSQIILPASSQIGTTIVKDLDSPVEAKTRQMGPVTYLVLQLYQAT